MHDRNDPIAVLRLVNEWLEYDDRGFFTWKKTKSSKASTGTVAGSVRKDGYIHLMLDGNFYLLHHLVWLIHNGVFPTKLCDHENKKRNDNRIENLRDFTYQQNNHNSDVARGISGIRHVRFIETNSNRPWMVRIQREGVLAHRSYHAEKSEAIEMAKRKAAELSAIETTETVVINQTKGKSMSEQNGTIIELDYNLADFEDFEPLPKGEYPGECTVAEVRTSDKGNQYFYTMWKIDASDYPADYDVANNPDGTVLNYSRLSVPSAANRRAVTAVKKFYAALGLNLKTNTIDCGSWVGQKAKLVVGAEPYNGEVRNSVTAVENLEA